MQYVQRHRIDPAGEPSHSVQRRGGRLAWRGHLSSPTRRLITPAGLCLVLALLFFISPRQALAHTVTGGPSFQANAGFETHYRNGNWIPVRVILHNDGPDFSGTLSLSAIPPLYLAQRSTAPASNYQLPISLPEGAQKQVTMYLALYFDVQSVTVKLLDSSGNAIRSQAAPLNPLMPGDILVGILSDQTSGFGPLSRALLPDPNSSVIIEFLDANTMPALSAALKNFNAIVLDNFTTANLSAAQLKALQTWVYQGGTLILVGGPEWRRTLGLLPTGLVPVTLNGTATIAPGTALLPPEVPAAGRRGVQSPVTISTATMPSPVGAQFTSDEAVLAGGPAPLLVQARQGQGTILYLAFDPTLEPILSWQGARFLWAGLLLRGMGDQLLIHASTPSSAASYGELEQPLLAYRMSALLQSLLPGTVAPPWWSLFIVLAGYLVLLGPVRSLLVRGLRRRDWSWRIVLSSIVVFSLLSYGLAFKEQGTSILSNSITIARFGTSPPCSLSICDGKGRGVAASLTTYMGVFVPNEGDFHIHIAGDALAQPSPDALPTTRSGLVSPTEESGARITPVQGGTDLTVQNASIWTLHSILLQREQQLPLRLVSHLVIQNGTLTGTVTNTFGYALSDAFLLLPNDVLSLGHLAAGQTKQVRLKLSSAPLPPNATLADLVALVTNAPAYDTLPASPRTAWQRHLAMLYALDGEGFYGPPAPCPGSCTTPVPLLPFLPALPSIAPAANSGVPSLIVTPGWPYTGTRDTDPLLVPGSPATLIGWAENPVVPGDNVTINDINPPGLHETLIQAPLTVNLSGVLNLPPNYIAGHLVAVEGSNMQFQYPGVYTISTGRMTFEYDIPGVTGLRISGLTIAEPPNINLYAQSGSIIDPDSLPFRLYNWHSNAWRDISLSQGTFTTNDVSAYIGPGGRVLLQLANENSGLGPFAFGKPLLNLQGVVSS